METTFYLPNDAEWLLGETRIVTLLDARVVSIAVKTAPSTGRGYDATMESETSFACRAWRKLLPDSDAGDALDFRLTYGWTRLQLTAIIALLDMSRAELGRLSGEGVLDGTRTALLRDAEKVDHLLLCWKRV